MGDLHNALNENAPEGFWFGDHGPGDPYSFGFWPADG